jgi:hypothetical protein
MSERWISIIVAVAAIGLGIDDVIEQRGSHILGHIGPHFTGLVAIVEGVVFIAFGCVLVYRVWTRRDQSHKK